MKVKEALKVHQGDLIKLGADNGYIYCEVCDERVFEVLRGYDRDETETIKTNLQRVTNYIDRIDRIWAMKLSIKAKDLQEKSNAKFEKQWRVKIKKKAAALREENKKRAEKGRKPRKTEAELFIELQTEKEKEKAELDEQIAREIELLTEENKEAQEDDLRKRKSYKERLEKRLESYTPIAERQVRDIYKAIYGETVILFEGLESGKYWSVKEYREAHYE